METFNVIEATQYYGDVHYYTLELSVPHSAPLTVNVSIEEMVAATAQPQHELCTACFDGVYPLGLPAGNPNAEAVRSVLGSES